jgi:hypothetical protein
VSKWTKFAAVAVAMAVAAGCGGDDNGGQSLSTAEKQALVNALQTTEFGGLAAFVIDVVGSVGTLDVGTVNTALTTAFDNALSLSAVGSQAADYEGGVGIALQFDYDMEGEAYSGWFYGVFGWNDINTTDNTVGEWVMVGGFGEEGTLPSSASGTIEGGDVFAWYSSNDTAYYGTSGGASITGSSFSGSTDCSSSQAGFTFDCSYSAGRMSGDFSFVALSFNEATYTQSPISFSNLPAVRMILSITDQ